MKNWGAVLFASVLGAATLLALGPLSGAQNNSRAPFQIVETSIADIHAAYRAGTLTARQVTQAYLDRIEAYDKRGPAINSIITLNPHALEDADRLDAACRASGPVRPPHRIPILVKDENDPAGVP